jgi:hypothetical protein
MMRFQIASFFHKIPPISFTVISSPFAIPLKKEGRNQPAHKGDNDGTTG